MQGQGDTDLWCTNVPCYGRNNTGEYNDLLFTQEAIRLIEANDPSVPFFMSAQHPSWPWHICPAHWALARLAGPFGPGPFGRPIWPWPVWPAHGPMGP